MEYTEGKQYVSFKLGMECFGLAIHKVIEIIVFQDTTSLPGSGSLIEGIINLRGRIIPVFNLRQKLGLPENPVTRNTRIVVVEANHSTVGLVVDQVNEVVMINSNLVEKPSEMLVSGLETNFINGVAKLENRLIILLNVDCIVTPHLSDAI